MVGLGQSNEAPRLWRRRIELASVGDRNDRMVLPMRHEEVDVAFCSPQRRLLLLLFMEPSERVSRMSLLLHCATIEAISHTFA
jgi:hypothetical protein